MSTTANNLITKNLVEFGLSEKEASIYLALLELEIATVQEVAKASGVNRSSAYVVLESLKKQGFVSVSEDKKVQRYVATSPDLLLHVAEDRARKQGVIKDKISSVIPDLKALYKDTKARPKVRVFEGKEGLISAFEDSLNHNEKMIRICFSVENLMKILPDYFPQYVQKRIQKGIKMLSIHPRDEIAEKLIKMFPKFDDAILVPREKYSFPADMAIYADKIGYMSSEKGGLAIIIESKEIAEVMKNIFDLAWEEAKRLNKSLVKK